MNTFPTDQCLSTEITSNNHIKSSFTRFKEVSVKDITHYINRVPNKYCPQVDTLPIELINKNVDILAPIFTTIVNKSISSGVVPNAYKEAVVTPIIKKTSPKPTFSIFRPVSNLPFISKIIERVVSDPINAFTDTQMLDEPLQSAFKKSHSTETALIKVQNDILMCMDQQQVVLIALLDLSAAFDTCYHNILLSRLETQFNISGVA